MVEGRSKQSKGCDRMSERALKTLKLKYSKELNATKNTNPSMTMKRELFTRFIELIDALLEAD